MSISIYTVWINQDENSPPTRRKATINKVQATKAEVLFFW